MEHKTRAQLGLGVTALLFFTGVYALVGSTDVESVTGSFVSSVTSSQRGFFALAGILVLAGVCAVYLSFVRR